MATSVTIPLWVAVLAGALAAVALIDWQFAPALRWWLRRRVNRAIEAKVRILPFKLAASIWRHLTAACDRSRQSVRG